MYGGQMMELADTRSLFREVRHPYTAALLDSIPDLNQPSHTRLATIEGRPLNMLNPPEGCRFAPRCRHATDACSAAVPAFVKLGDRDRGVRCILPSALAPAADPAPQHALSEI
jgi:peptide/nickel transport system ATP-binding protein